MNRARASAVELADWRPTLERVGWLTAALFVVAAPHALRLPAWVSGAFVAFAAWRWMSLRRGWWIPGRWLTAALSAAVVIGVALEYRTVLGRDAGVALLTVLAAMKLLEVRAARDAYVTVCLALFLVITNFLYSQSIAMGAYMVASTVISVAALTAVTHIEPPIATLRRLRIAGVVVMQAVPVMLVLFVAFPRVSGPLWGLPNDAHAGRAGLSDNMSPGDISNLSLSNAVAFRVKFDGPPPPAETMYWRGPVLEVTNGRRWTRAPQASAPMRDGAGVGNRRAVSYEVTLEPTNKRWIFALELPVELGVPVSMNSRAELRRSAPVRERMRYRARSMLDFRLEPSSPLEHTRALALPGAFHPAARRLAAGWRTETDDPRALVERALAHFTTEPFFYSLQPPLADRDPIDEFLFLSRRGFCEHYAAAFTVLMRAAGVPARVVTGYQGGEWNEVGGYWIVRQRDAHAWSEVWIRGAGWVRVDPTAAVSPDRIEQGIDAAMPETSGDALLGLSQGGAVSRLWRRMRLGWDAVNDSWNQWVLGYGVSRQRSVLASLGIDTRDWREVAAFFIGTVLLAVLLTGAWMLSRRVPVPVEVAAYRAFCARLARLGVHRQPWEGPVDFARRAAGQCPHLAADVNRITALYVSVRYAAAHGQVGALRDAVRHFRPARA